MKPPNFLVVHVYLPLELSRADKYGIHIRIRRRGVVMVNTSTVTQTTMIMILVLKGHGLEIRLTVCKIVFSI